MVSDPFLKRISGWAGFALAVVCAALAFEFGIKIGILVAGGAVIVSFLNAYVPAIVTDIWRNHGWQAGAPSMFAAVIVAGAELLAASSTLTVQRTADQTSSLVQNTRYEDTRKSIADLEAQVRMFEARESDLKGKQGWSGLQASASYDGLIAAKKLAIANESKRVRCGTVCERLTQELGELQANQAVSAAHERDKAMYEATQKKLAAVRLEAKDDNIAVSASQTQNLKLASIFTMDRKPGDGAMFWTDTGVGIYLGVAMTVTAMWLCWVAHGGGQSLDFLRRMGGATDEKPAPQPRYEPLQPAPQAPVAHAVEDYSERLNEALTRLKLQGGQGVTGPARIAAAA